jgi:hypothetical protein
LIWYIERQHEIHRAALPRLSEGAAAISDSDFASPVMQPTTPVLTGRK